MGLKIVTGRTGTPHVSSNQIQAFNRSLLGDLAILDLGQHFDAVVRDANTIRIYDGCIVVQGIYAIIPHDEYEDILVEPVSVGNTRIDTIYLHYAKDMENDTESVEIDIAQGEEAVNNPVKPDIDAGGDTWEGTTDIRIPLYDVTVTSFETTITAYEYMDVYSPTISDLQERIPETTVSGVKGDAESEYRSGNVNITPANIGLGNVDNTSDLDKPISTAAQTALNDKVDKVQGKGLSTNDYTDTEKQKNADNASAISEIQEDISTSLTFISRERRNITSDLGRLSTAVAEQNLAKYGYKIGDYFTGASGYTYILADYNTFKGTSTPYCITSNHLGIVVDTHKTSQWHSGDASDVGYNGSVLNTFLKGTVLDTIKTDFKALFGGSTGLEHLIAHSKLYTTALANWAWQANQYISALSEMQVIGSTVWSANGYQTGEAAKKLEIFNKYKWTEIFENRYPWLRNMQSASNACNLGSDGGAYYFSVTGADCVVGLINFF
jgi:hypothetical protein